MTTFDQASSAVDTINFQDLFRRATRGSAQILGFAFVGVVVASLASMVLNRTQLTTTSARVMFSFPGFERGEYPDKSKFQPDDLRAPAVLAEAIRRQNLDGSSAFQSKIRGALSVEAIIPLNITKERDRLRAAGQTLLPFVADEYEITLSLPRNFSLSNNQRHQLLNEILAVYHENFNRTYAAAPLAFGTAFATLYNADFPEYQLILDKELESITNYLEQLVAGNGTQQSRTTEGAATFRSTITNLSFRDLLEQAQLFAQIRLNESLGLIHQNGLSKDRATALVKMDYYIRVLENQERRAVEEDKVVTGLLRQAQEREQNYVLGIKSQAAQQRTETPILDQGLIDSLLANDAYNFLVRRALEAGLRVKQIQAEKARLLELRQNMSSFVDKNVGDQAEIVGRVGESLKNLELAYNRLVKNIRDTYSDFAHQQYGNAVRISTPITTDGMLKPLAVAAIFGGFLGFALGAGLSLLGIYIGKSQMA